MNKWNEISFLASHIFSLALFSDSIIVKYRDTTSGKPYIIWAYLLEHEAVEILGFQGNSAHGGRSRAHWAIPTIPFNLSIHFLEKPR